MTSEQRGEGEVKKHPILEDIHTGNIKRGGKKSKKFWDVINECKGGSGINYPKARCSLCSKSSRLSSIFSGAFVIDNRIGLTKRGWGWGHGGEGERERDPDDDDAAKDNLSALFTLTNQTVASVQAGTGG